MTIKAQSEQTTDTPTQERTPQFWLVFEIRPRRDTVSPLSTFVEAMAVVRAPSAEAACRMVAGKTRRLNPMFAVAGEPWGAELLVDEAAEEWGSPPKEDDVETRLRQLERGQLP